MMRQNAVSVYGCIIPYSVLSSYYTSVASQRCHRSFRLHDEAYAKRCLVR